MKSILMIILAAYVSFCATLYLGYSPAQVSQGPATLEVRIGDEQKAEVHKNGRRAADLKPASGSKKPRPPSL